MTGVVGDLNATPSFHGPNRPVVKVSWNDVQVFLQRLNNQQSSDLPKGWRYVLPTEAQWEYACRAGTSSAFSWGNTVTSLNANFQSSGFGQSVDVGQYNSNPWGFHDMHGNVYEWCFDFKSAYSVLSQVDPIGPSSGNSRVRRGGSYANAATSLRSAERNYGQSPDYRDAIQFPSQPTNKFPFRRPTSNLYPLLLSPKTNRRHHRGRVQCHGSGHQRYLELLTTTGMDPRTPLSPWMPTDAYNCHFLRLRVNASSYSIRVQAKDEYNATTEKVFSVSLSDDNEAPSNLQSISSLTIAETSLSVQSWVNSMPPIRRVE